MKIELQKILGIHETMLVNGHLIFLGPVGILNLVKFNLNYLFQAFLGPTNSGAINTANCK